MVAVEGGLLSGLRGTLGGPSLSLATISSSMADIKVPFSFRDLPAHNQLHVGWYLGE